MQKPQSFTISIWYGTNMYIPDKIPNSWKCENPMLIWYLFKKCGWLGTLMHRLAAEPCSTAGLLFTSRCLSGTILLTPYSIVWDRRVSRAGPMILYWPKLLYPCSIPALSILYTCDLRSVFNSFSLSFLSVYRLVLWGWGLRTDWVCITLSQPCTADLLK